MTEITIDIDEDYDAFLKGPGMDELTEKLRGVFPNERYIRKSSNGHVHVKIIVNDVFSTLAIFCIRAHLGDDPKRISADLERYFFTNDETKIMRLFDAKYKNGSTGVVGNWVAF